MANANFFQSENRSDPGGFDAGSYREVKTELPEENRTPLQKKLAKLESALPAALATQATAAILCLVIMLVSAVGFGGSKLRAKYSEAKQWYSAGVEADGGYNLAEELSTRANATANILTTAGHTLEASDVELLAAQEALNTYQQALAAYEDGTGTLHSVYEANVTLSTAVDALYSKLKTALADSSRAGAVQSEYSKFNSSQTVLNHLSYNNAVTEYQNETGGFPAVVLKPLFGIRKVETFA